MRKSELFPRILLVLILFSKVFIMPMGVFGAPFAEYKVKAAFLLKLADFVEWPSDVSDNATVPINVGVVGNDPFGDLLPEEISQADGGCGFAFKVRRLFPKDEYISSFNILFFPRTSQDAFVAIQSLISDKPVLTVGEGESFIDQGGMIAFTLENNRVQFIANLKRCRKAHLNISAKLLVLAKKVIK
ncbi:MAG: YfiR family protein [Candidatus Riflebacteria bacterium]|nr:YfiR family protein [Candidatus Riflebacteria bacterium]